jgi:hypothetical protein
MKLATLKAQVAAMRGALDALETSLAKEEAKRAIKKGGVAALPASPEASDVESSEAPPAEKAKERAPNPWFIFTKRVDALLKENNLSIKAPESKQFASSLKAKKGYEWKDEEILEEKKSWVKPEKAGSTITTEVDKIMEEITSDSGSVSGSESDKPKKRGRPSKKTAQ